jgi:hypothetical protein
MTTSIACPACDEGVRAGRGAALPEDWRPLAEHPQMKPGAWVPKGEADGVLFCRACGALWRRSLDEGVGAPVSTPVPVALRPLLSGDVKPAQAAAPAAAPDLDAGARQAAAGLVSRYFEAADFDFTEAAEALLKALDTPGIVLTSARTLVEALASVVTRAAQTFPDPAPPPSAATGAAKSWAEARKNARPPREEVRPKDALVRIASIKSALRARTRPKGDLAPVDAAHARQAIRSALEEVYLATLEEVRRKKLLFMTPEDWDALEEEIARRPGVRRIIAAIGRALVSNDPALAVLLWESAVELRALATPESERIPKRLHGAAEKGPVLQSTDVRTLLKAADLVAARPDGAAASAEVMALLREELERERITREVIIEVRDRMK